MGATIGGLAFLAFEDAGEELTAADFQDDGMRSAALEALHQIHACGVACFELSRRHFRKDVSGGVRLIDFRYSTAQATEDDQIEDLINFEKLVRPGKEDPLHAQYY